MFTGIVEEIGRVAAVDRRPGATRLEIACGTARQGVQVGDSVAVSGVCLTVVAIDGARGTLAFEAVPETLRRTNLGLLDAGAPVNLERALAAGRAMGGHYVQGHVDGTVRVTKIEEDGEAHRYVFDLPPDLARFVVPQGFVALDGASLTVVRAGEGTFEITLIPHTRAHVVMGAAAPGYVANLEVDVMGKYAERSAAARLREIEARLGRLEARDRTDLG